MKTELQNLIDECTTELTDISAKISALPPLDKTRAYLTKYALIKSCGTIEFVYRSLVADYFDKAIYHKFLHILKKRLEKVR